ncbi:DNA primase DnaG [Halobacterium hubeiense]|uniref:DNA primase DnaG n=1 Tax=Halobacterium hubeiense TaxID=1407499 RepID=A0A0U5H3X3_9EURY|nr:DNA primase DnaG [Halobacterium hubeiense]CQH59840.1 DNA primase DnaG [Halobacterium hubeiense]
MEDTAKYLIHADFVADGVVERTDVVGAAFGQTEGLLGDDLDIRDLQDSAKLGRIDVAVDSEGGQSFGTITIASSLDRVETATLAAALEAVERIGPCRAQVEVDRIEDVRAAKRREIVDRAKELLASAFDEGAIDSDDILREVRESVRVEDVTEYEGLPAGPNVATSDAVLVVEGRADVVNLLQYGIKNAVAVEGTNVPDAVADLTRERTATAFLDGDRGGDLILRELRQVGDLDYVARPPDGESVEDLSRGAVDAALREKSPADTATLVSEHEDNVDEDETQQNAVADASTAENASATEDAPAETVASAVESVEATAATDGSATPAPEAATATTVQTEPDSAAEPEPVSKTVADHVEAVVGSGTVRLLGDDLDVLAEGDADGAMEVIDSASTVPRVVVLDGPVTQRLLDVAAQRGVAKLVGTSAGEFVKQPAGVRVHTADDY